MTAALITRSVSFSVTAAVMGNVVFQDLVIDAMNEFFAEQREYNELFNRVSVMTADEKARRDFLATRNFGRREGVYDATNGLQIRWIATTGEIIT